MATTSRAIILCADDYALHPMVDDAVVQLTLSGRLSATSCMTTSPRWQEAAQQLHALRPRLSVGLHFNLTESHQGAIPAQTLKNIIWQSYTRQWEHTALRRAWQQQLDAFEQAMGSPPDFIDGHQHVHQLPGMRQAMLAELQARYTSAQMPWVRSTAPAGSLWKKPKAAIIALLGGWANTRSLRKAGLRMNRGFGGVYGFDAPSPQRYGAQMAQWLEDIHTGSLLMCHPATDVVQGDAIGAQRPIEFTYLLSSDFGALLTQHNCHIQQGPLHDFMHKS